ncbi:MAG: FAD-dependent oxidoreductase [Clostridiales bacterium]|nr:FAD-dependent oxidoreductase [Clostridiales bacterium]MCF8023694.1 FAD-dependent oxidoreductase [Clostridiales bacterium]
MRKYDYLIIGNSAAAVGCIEGIRSVDKKSTIAVISEEKHHVYSRALIPYYLEGKIDRDKMNYRPAGFYEQARVSLFINEKVNGIKYEENKVCLSSGEFIEYGKLLLATGGKPIIPPIKGLDKNNVFTFLSMDDVLKIEKALSSAKNAVVLGGGVIGLMAAEVLHKKGLNVHVLELADRVLAPVVDEHVSCIIEKAFNEQGASIHTSNTIQEIHGKENVESITLQDGTSIPCDLLIVGVGVSPRVELAEGTGMEVNRGIVVNKKMQTTVPGVFACGDCASIYDFILGENRPLPLWPNAYAGGRVAAFNMAGIEKEYTWGTSMNSMHFFDLNIINAGLNISYSNSEYEIIHTEDENKKTYRKFVLDKNGVLVGLILAGPIARAGIFLNLMRKNVDVRPFKEELLCENFGYASIPEELRWTLLKDDVILGVV